MIRKLQTYARLLQPRSEPADAGGAAQPELSASRSEAALCEERDKYRLLFEAVDEGFCIIEILFGENGERDDYRFLEINPAFEKQTGLVEAVGKCMRELAPDHEEHWFERYARIARTRQAERFEDQAAALGRWYDVFAFPIGKPEENRVAILFRDVLARRTAQLALQDSEEQQSFVLKLSDALRPLADATEIQATTTRMIGDHLGVDRAMYAEVAGGRGSEVGTIRGQYVRPANAGGLALAPFPEHFTFEPFGAEVMARRYSGEGLIVADVETDPAFDAAARAAWAAAGVRAAIVAPLVKEGRLVAEFGVHAATARAWTEAEVSLLREVAERTWAAAERARAEAALRETEERNAFLLRFSDAVRGISDPTLVARESCRILTEQLGTDRTFWAVIDWDAREYVAQWAFLGDGTPVVPTRWPLDEREPFAREHLAGRPVVYADTNSDALIPAPVRTAMRERGLLAGIAVPVLVGGRLLAVLNTSQSHAPRHWTLGEVSFVEALAGRAWGEIERARAQAALRESEERLQLALEAGEIAVYEWDLVSDRVTAGSRFRELVGIGPDVPLVGAQVLEHGVHVDDRARVDADMARAMRGESNGRYVFEHRLGQSSKDGGRWALSQGQVYFAGSEGDRRPARIVGTLLDITDRKRAEAALRESEERQAFQLRLSDSIRPLSDPVEVVTVACELLGRHLGVGRCGYGQVDETDEYFIVERDWTDGTMPSFKGKHLLVSFGPEFTAAYRAGESVRIDDGLADARAAGAEAAFEAAGGVRASLGIPLIKEGRFTAGLFVQQMGPRHWTDQDEALARDMVERTWAAIERARAEKALRESEERLQSAMAISTVGVLFWGPDHRLTQVNDAFLRFTGFTREEAIGKSWNELTPPEFHAASERCLEEVRETGEGTPYEKQYYRKDGSRWWGLFASRALGEKETVEFVTDVSERRRTEEALRESERYAKMLLAELQHRVRNILAMIRSVARRTGDTAETVQDYVQHLEGRISAMAHTQALLTRDIDAAVDLQSLILDELTMQAAQPEQYRVTGPDIALPAKAAEVLGLALHELATNAVKYGALSDSGRRLDIQWALHDGEEAPQLRLIWSEFGVRIDGEPSRKGFGTELITQRVPYELYGTGTLDFRPTGLVATLEFPLADMPSILQTDEGRQGTP